VEEIVYLNGSLIQRHEAKISVMDYGFLYGYGLFETMRAYNGIVFQMDNHLNRLAESAAQLDIPINTLALRNAVIETIQANRLKEARIRLSISIGEGSPTPNLCSCGQTTALVVATPYTPYESEIYTKGFSIMVSSIQRNSRSYLLSMKTSNYLENFLSLVRARSCGVDEALFLNEKNLITEASTSNVFLMSNNILKTPHPKNGLLLGITRGIVLELATQCGISTLEGDIQLEELLNADEVFLTNSIIEIMPVTMVNNKKINSGTPGQITRTLMNDYRNIVKKKTLNQDL
jgi:branched-chain amino acid aminotransferase